MAGDDGDKVSGDGCSSSCAVETGWTCTGGTTDISWYMALKPVVMERIMEEIHVMMLTRRMAMGVRQHARLKLGTTALEAHQLKETTAMKYVGMASIWEYISVMMVTLLVEMVRFLWKFNV